jgi:hypothetical protein
MKKITAKKYIGTAFPLWDYLTLPRRPFQSPEGLAISAENLITGCRTHKRTAKGEGYTEIRKGKYRHDISHNSCSVANLAVFHTGLKHRFHRKNMLAPPKPWISERISYLGTR